MGFTKNGRRFLGACTQGTGSTSYANAIGNHAPFINQNNEEARDYWASSSAYTGVFCRYVNNNICGMEQSTSYGTSSISNCLCVGCDDTKESINDYFVGNSGLICSEQSFTSGTDNFFKSFSCTVSNNTNDKITVKEVGWAIFTKMNSDSAPQNVLMFRKVLDTPVTILPDETYTFTLILK